MSLYLPAFLILILIFIPNISSLGLHIGTILQSKLGQFIDGIDKDNISMGLWSGNLLIENATLKAEAFENSNFLSQ